MSNISGQGAVVRGGDGGRVPAFEFSPVAVC